MRWAVGLGAAAAAGPGRLAAARASEEESSMHGVAPDALQVRSPGQIVWRGDPDYEATRRHMVWNQRVPERFPEAIAVAGSDQDVVDAVRLARSRGLRVAIRSGGHSWVGSSLRDGGMLIDLEHLNGAEVNVAARTAVVQPAIKNPAIVAALAPLGLAFPTGHCPTVSVGGYLLSGGQGWNQGTWGPACQNVLAIDYVNADGDVI